ncbi:MAG: aldo/keto reductase [Halanaerobiaceae bacterium]
MSKCTKLGRTGLEVFPLAFGGIPIQRLTEKQAVEVVKRSVELGVNLIDTARAYSESEEKIGKALPEIEKRVFLATKTPATDRQGALKDVDKSLKMLGVDKIDIYQLHGVNDDENYKKVMEEGGALEGLKQARAEGKIDYIGITGHSNEILLKALKTDEFATVQFCYNFIENDCEKELIPYARENNIGMIGMKPLAGGRFRNASVALKYVLSQEGVVPDPGIETIEEIEENVEIAAGDLELTDEEKETMKEIREELGTVFCRRCEYCQPCPQEIPISLLLRAESFINRMPLDSLKSGFIADAFSRADECTECGVCMERCPYDLPIPDLIKENKKIMDEYLS